MVHILAQVLPRDLCRDPLPQPLQGTSIGNEGLMRVSGFADDSWELPDRSQLKAGEWAESPYSAPSDLEGDIHEFLLRKDKEIEKLIGLHSPVRLH